MAASIISYELPSFSPVTYALPQLRDAHQDNHFVSQDSFIRDSHESLVRASTFIQFQKANEPHPEGRGMIWKGLRTPPKCNFELPGPKGPGFPFLDEESSVLLKGLGSRDMTRPSKGSCLHGLTAGVVGSFLLENPLPLLLGLSECFLRASAQQKVGNEFQVNTYTNSIQKNPAVASFSNDNFIVTWQSDGQDGDVYGVYGQLFNGNGTKIGSEFQANSYTPYQQKRSSAASFSNGDFVVTWEDSRRDGSGHGVYGQLFYGNGTKIGGEFRANSNTPNHQLESSVASFSNGDFVVTWESYGQDGSGVGIYGQLFNGTGTKIGSEFQVNTFTTSDQRSPSLASFSNGNFVVTWASDGQDGSDYGVYGQLFNDNGSKIGSEFQANTFTNYSQARPSVAGLNDGNFIVTWQSCCQNGSSNGVFGQLFNGTGSKIESEFQANTFTNYSQAHPSVASLSNGKFVVTWHSDGQDGSSFGVYGQLFDGSGTKIGSEFQVNTYTNSSQELPSVASFSNGNFVVTWQSDFQDGSGFGIYGQIFDNITYPSSSTKTSSSTTSTTKTTSSSITSSISSGTMSTIDRTRTSVNPSSSRTTVLSTTRSITTSNSQATLSATSDPSNRFFWVWFLLGGIGAVSCLGLIGYFIFKSRDRKKDGTVPSLELGEREQTDDSTPETHYQRTPNFVTEQAGEEPLYELTPDHVGEEPLYGLTPDHVTEGAGEEPLYGATPHFVTAKDGGH